MQRRVGRHRFDRAHHALRSIKFAEMFEPHHDRPRRADRIGETLAHDVECRAGTSSHRLAGILDNVKQHGRSCQDKLYGRPDAPGFLAC